MPCFYYDLIILFEFLQSQTDCKEASSPSVSIELACDSAKRAKAAAAKRRVEIDNLRYADVRRMPDASTVRQVEHLSAKGVSSWLNILPLKEHGFSLSSCDFRDAIVLRYGRPLKDVPLTFVCCKDFTPAHAMCFPTGKGGGGFPTSGTML